MKRVRLVIMLVNMFLIGVLPLIAQSDTPDILSFTTSFTSIGRDALTNRTARIPVTWSTVNRPLSANLFFEQVLPDGSTINVELPRLIPYVASSGNGIAAPILPAGNATSIRLRVTLKSIFNSTVYDSMEITIPIVNGNGGTGTGETPSLTRFTAPANFVVSRSQLNAGTVQIPVSWTAINRPITANLVFEQVLANGSVVNVELPRPFLWVNSSDNGIVAPVAPGGNDNNITLRVRLVDLVFNRNYDVRYYYIPIEAQAAEPVFLSFAPGAASIERSVVAAGNARINVVWSLANRPQNTNLVFEQVLPDGTVRNAELPRDFILVPSSGSGVVTALLPNTTVGELVYRLRLVNLSNQATLLTTQMTVTLTGNNSGGALAFDSLTVTPSNVPAAQRNSANLRVAWQTNRATSIRIEAANYVANVPNVEDGDFLIPLADVNFAGNTLQITVTARDASNNAVNRTLLVTIGDVQPTVLKSFTVPSNQIEAGSNVTISWEIIGALTNAQLAFSNGSSTTTLKTFNTSGTGNFVWTVPEALEGNYNLTLTVTVTASAQLSDTIAITVNQPETECAYEWQVDVDTEECPAASASATGAYQRFDRGFMVYDPSSSQSMIVFYNNGTMSQYTDNWNGAEYTISGTPPDGKVAPERGFGYLWSTVPLVRSSLDWGAAPEVTHTVLRQSTESGGATYMTLPDGRLVRFGGGTWQLVA